MSRQHPKPEKRHRSRLLSGVLFREPARPRGGASRALLIVGGLLAIVAGVALVVLPVVPGFPLVIIGVLMIAAASPWARGVLNRFEQRLPSAVRAPLRRLTRRVKEQIARRFHRDDGSSASQDSAPERAR